jgi:hypothetical protein
MLSLPEKKAHNTHASHASSTAAACSQHQLLGVALCMMLLHFSFEFTKTSPLPPLRATYNIIVAPLWHLCSLLFNAAYLCSAPASTVWCHPTRALYAWPACCLRCSVCGAPAST